MKRTLTKTNWTELAITTGICLLPIVAGAVLYDRLPDPMPIHFNVAGEADNWGPKWFALFGLPIITAVLQVVTYVIAARNTPSSDERPRIATITYWMIPVLVVLIYALMVSKALGIDTPLARILLLVVGIGFMAMGNYTPKMSFESAKGMFHPTPTDEADWRRKSRLTAYLLIGLGIVTMVVGWFFW